MNSIATKTNKQTNKKGGGGETRKKKKTERMKNYHAHSYCSLIHFSHQNKNLFSFLFCVCVGGRGGGGGIYIKMVNELEQLICRCLKIVSLSSIIFSFVSFLKP